MKDLAWKKNKNDFLMFDSMHNCFICRQCLLVRMHTNENRGFSVFFLHWMRKFIQK